MEYFKNLRKMRARERRVHVDAGNGNVNMTVFPVQTELIRAGGWGSALQVFAGVWIVRNDHGDGRAGVHFRAIAAGREAFLQCALTDGAEPVAVDGLDAVGAAAFAVDVFRQDRDVVELGPQFRGLLTQRLIVVNRGEVGVAFFAVQAAAGDHGFHGLVLHSGVYS